MNGLVAVVSLALAAVAGMCWEAELASRSPRPHRLVYLGLVASGEAALCAWALAQMALA